MSSARATHPSDRRTPDDRAAVAPAESPPPPSIETTSFDPKSWKLDKLATPPSAPDASAARRPPTGPLAAAITVVVLLALGGGFLAWRAVNGSSKLQTQTAAAAPSDAQRIALEVASPGDIQAALVSAHIAPAEAQVAAEVALAKLAPASGDLTLIMTLAPAPGGSRLLRIDARHEDGAGVIVQPVAAGGFAAMATAADLKTTIKVVRGEMDAYSFYSSAVAQHLTDALISPFAQALAFDFDFQREVHQGDIFEAVFEDRVNREGHSVGVGRLLYVSLETKAKSRALYWFQPPGGDGGWFDGNGRSTVRSLMRTPVEGARVSSTFGMRVHPVLGFEKMHKGVDFAAPVGTPIYAAGDGVVNFAAMAGTAGNRVILHHDNGWETWYLHMNRFGPGVASGVRVRQGQELGEVGTTGQSTGPHLHYEVHVDGEPVDPATLQMDSGRALAGAELKAFDKERDRIDALRVAQAG